MVIAAFCMEISVGTVLEPEKIPDKLYFKIGEVCDITGIKSHTLRFWESEFKVIRPRRASSNQRLYRREDVEVILKIKHLIQEEGHTIAGTRRCLVRERESEDRGSGPSSTDATLLKRIKKDLQELQALLKR
jgi:DNA-binding transcriptional MerR regulator